MLRSSSDAVTESWTISLTICHRLTMCRGLTTVTRVEHVQERERDVLVRFSLWKRAESINASLMWNLVSVGGLVRLKLTTRFLVQRKLGGQQLMLRAPSCGTGALQVLKRIEKAKNGRCSLNYYLAFCQFCFRTCRMWFKQTQPKID